MKSNLSKNASLMNASISKLCVFSFDEKLQKYYGEVFPA